MSGRIGELGELERVVVSCWFGRVEKGSGAVELDRFMSTSTVLLDNLVEVNGGRVVGRMTCWEI
jgi:hypothetical protein